MKLSWYGTASVLLKDDDGVIAFDPFDGIFAGDIKNPPTKLPHEGVFRSAEAVFVTHGHFDHIYHLPRLYADTETTVFCTKTPEKKLISNGLSKSRICRIFPGWQGTVCGFKVSAFQGRHCKFDIPIIEKTVTGEHFFEHPIHLVRLLELEATYHENDEILFYEVERGGVRIQIMGSMNLDPAVDYPVGADALILPFQGRSDADRYALDFIDRLKPQTVYLDHYDNTFEPITSDVDFTSFVGNTEDRFGVECIPLEREREYIIKCKELNKNV